jgi:DNA-binding IclR family transcriptional regulator
MRENMEKTTTRKNLIQSVERALNILETVRNAKTPIRAIDIARVVGLSSAAANNIVRTLYIRGYLEQDEQGRYMLGIQSYLLSTAADAWSDLRTAAREPMLELSRETGNLSFLGVECSGQIIAVNIAEGSGPLVVPRNQDWLDQFHCTATGKIILAAMDKDSYATFKLFYQLHKLTEKTITDWNVLEQEIAKVRQDGYAVCLDESVFGITSVAVPILDIGKKTVAALAVSYSSYYNTQEYREEMLEKLQTAARKIATAYSKRSRK